jgi:hypothetical protein
VFGHPLKETKFFYRGENDGLSGEQIHRAYLDIYQQTNDPKLTTVRAASSSHCNVCRVSCVVCYMLRAACCRIVHSTLPPHQAKTLLEATPGNFFNPKAARRIAAACPNAKLLIIVR